MKPRKQHARHGFSGRRFTRRRFARLGFTLLELVLVMVIIVIALSIVAPKLSGFSRGRQLHDAADQFLSMTRLARSQAATNGTVYRITIDAQNGSYQLTRQDGQNFVAIQNDMGSVQQLPGAVHIQMKREEQQQPQQQSSGAMTSGLPSPQPTPQDSIDFFPSGRTQPGQIILTASDGDTLVIECPSAAEDFAISSNKTNS